MDTDNYTHCGKCNKICHNSKLYACKGFWLCNECVEKEENKDERNTTLQRETNNCK